MEFILIGVFILSGCVGLAWMICPPPSPMDFIVDQAIIVTEQYLEQEKRLTDSPKSLHP